MGSSEHRMPTRLPSRIDRQGLSNCALVLDLVDQALAHLVAIPRQTQERFVQMGMCFDQAWQSQFPLSVKHRHACRRGNHSDGRNIPCPD
jgi:hypothetical protein